MARFRLAHHRTERPRSPRSPGRVPRSRSHQRQAHLPGRPHHQRQRRIVHGEQSEIPRNGAHPRRSQTGPTGVAITMPAKTKFEVKIGPATREAFGKTLVDLGHANKDVVVCDADLAKSTMTVYFQKEFPERFISCGIAEANMVGIGAGLAYAGKIPFVSSFSAFVINRSEER